MMDGGGDEAKKPRLDELHVRFDCSGMKQHFEAIDVEPDDGRQQSYSCVANGKLYCESEIEVLAAVLKGVDVTEISSPKRVTKLCRKYGLMQGDSFYRVAW